MHQIRYVIVVLGNLQVDGIAGLKAIFASNFPIGSAKSKWTGLQQAAEGTMRRRMFAMMYSTYLQGQ